jgi:predicted transcriptional regulator
VYTIFKNNIKERIIKILKEHPEGLTTVEIVKISRISRITVTKYIYQLLGEDMINQRKVGSAKLCFLR